jgi:hypothetical protein
MSARGSDAALAVDTVRECRYIAQNLLSRDGVTADGVWIDNLIYWTLALITTNNYDLLTGLHTPKITVTTAHIKSSQPSLAVAW